MLPFHLPKLGRYIPTYFLFILVKLKIRLFNAFIVENTSSNLKCLVSNQVLVSNQG